LIVLCVDICLVIAVKSLPVFAGSQYVIMVSGLNN